MVDSETSIQFSKDVPENGQQMMACEYVAATLFYRLFNDERLSDMDLKIITAIHAIGQQAGASAWIMESIDRYMELFPEDRAALTDIVVATTYGATVSKNAVRMYERAARAGHLGAADTFVQDAQNLLSALRELTAAIANTSTAQTTSMWANLGLKLWLLNTDFLIAPQSGRRTALCPWPST